MFKGVKAWWRHLDGFDRSTLRNIGIGFVLFVLFWAFLIVGGNVAVSISAGEQQGSHATVALTVVETTTRMEGDSAAAVATDPDGVKVLLYGNWVEGQTVNAYAYPGPAGTQPVYSTDMPDAGAGAAALLGAGAGVLLWVLALLGVFEWWNRRKEHARVSKSIISAALR